MHQYPLLARGRVMDEPGLLEFQPALGVKIVQFVGRHIPIVNGKS
jgi:hypothetical protein